jgi:hypothetical protein
MAVGYFMNGVPRHYYDIFEIHKRLVRVKLKDPLKTIHRLLGFRKTVLNSACPYPSSLILPSITTENVELFLSSPL